MNDYKRLTYKNDDGEWAIQFPQCTILDVFRCFLGANGEKYYTGTLVDRFAELEDKIENGEWITKESCLSARV